MFSTLAAVLATTVFLLPGFVVADLADLDFTSDSAMITTVKSGRAVEPNGSPPATPPAPPRPQPGPPLNPLTGRPFAEQNGARGA